MIIFVQWKDFRSRPAFFFFFCCTHTVSLVHMTWGHFFLCWIIPFALGPPLVDCSICVQIHALSYWISIQMTSSQRHFSLCVLCLHAYGIRFFWDEFMYFYSAAIHAIFLHVVLYVCIYDIVLLTFMYAWYFYMCASIVYLIHMIKALAMFYFYLI